MEQGERLSKSYFIWGCRREKFPNSNPADKSAPKPLNSRNSSLFPAISRFQSHLSNAIGRACRSVAAVGLRADSEFKLRFRIFCRNLRAPPFGVFVRGAGSAPAFGSRHFAGVCRRVFSSSFGSSKRRPAFPRLWAAARPFAQCRSLGARYFFICSSSSACARAAFSA